MSTKFEETHELMGTEEGDALFVAQTIASGAVDTPLVRVTRVFCLACGADAVADQTPFTAPIGVVRAFAGIPHDLPCLGRLQFETEPVPALPDEHPQEENRP